MKPTKLVQIKFSELFEHLATYAMLEVQNLKDGKIVHDQINQKIIVTNSLDEIRELILNDSSIYDGKSAANKKWVIILKYSIDIYEEFTAKFWQENEYQKFFSQSGIKKHIIHISEQLVENLKYISLQIRNPKQKYLQYQDMSADINFLFNKIEELKRNTIHNIPLSAFSKLKNSIRNLKVINQEIQQLIPHIHSRKLDDVHMNEDINVKKFVSKQNGFWLEFKNNLSLKSDNFRFAIRFCLTYTIAFILAQKLPWEQGYWIGLTVLVLMKSSFSITKFRVWARIGGTIMGGLIGYLLIYFFHGHALLYVLLPVFCFLAFTLIKDKYFIGVLFLTPTILLLFGMLNYDGAKITMLRVGYTLLGAILVFLANYLILPNWQKRSIHSRIKSAIELTYHFWLRLLETMDDGQWQKSTSYKLARKDAQIALVNLSNSFQAMLKEPKQNQDRNNLTFDVIQDIFDINKNLARFVLVKNRSQSHMYLESEKNSIDHIKSIFLAIIKQLEEGPALHPTLFPHALPGNKYLDEILKTRMEELAEKPDSQQYKETFIAQNLLRDILEEVYRDLQSIYKKTAKIYNPTSRF